MKQKLVIDTNILVAALKSPTGKAYRLLDDVLNEKYDIICSEEIFHEYDEVLHREEFGFEELYVNYILLWFRGHADFVTPLPSTESMIDPDDRIFFDTAKVRNAKLVTFNLKHYPVHELRTSISELYPD